MNGRNTIIQIVIVLSALIFSIRLFSIQVVDEEYKLAAENNIVQKIIDYPYRGLILDRSGEILVSNTPVFDLMIVPKEVDLADSTTFRQILGLTHGDFMMRYHKSKDYSPILASKFMEQIPNTEFAAIQDQLVQYKGFYALPRTVREYAQPSLSNALGYVAEIDKPGLARDTSDYYRSGDYIGKTGVEKTYEPYLRGKRGVRYQLVNVQGVVKGAFRDGEFDTLSIPGENVRLTINMELQRYAEQLMAGKVGSAVAIDPKTGEILAIVSVPSYAPELLSGRDIGKNFAKIESDTLKPLFNRPIQATYAPGSMFKTIQALVAMQERVITPTEKIYCDGALIGDLAPPGIYDIKRGITLSSNNFFFRVFRRIIQQEDDPNPYLDSRVGLEKWNSYIRKFGLGRQLGVDLPNENSGYVPDLSYYDRYYGENRWKFSNIYSLSIGQGELLVTPLQMANLGAILANRGHYFVPHIVKEIEGEGAIIPQRMDVGIDAEYFPVVVDGMEQVVNSGSAIRAYTRDIVICGKTSTVQNSAGDDHSGFMGFAPKDDPQIAIAVYVENAGWGGRAAASTASLMIEKYLTGQTKRWWLEEYVLQGDFKDVKKKKTVSTDTSVIPTPQPKSVVADSTGAN